MDFEHQLRAAFAPCDPRPELRSTILSRRLALIASGGKGRNGNRTILIGTILAVAAAAAMLSLHLADMPEPHVAELPAAVPDMVLAAAVDEEPSVARVTPEPLTTKTIAPEQVLPPFRPFIVRLLPLQNEATDPGANAAITSFFTAFVNDLQAVPGLSLINSDADDSDGRELPDFQLTVIGGGSDLNNRFSIRVLGDEKRFIEIKQKHKEPSAGFSFIMSVGGELIPPCVTATNGSGSSCGSPAALAASLVESMRIRTFPENPLLRVHLQNQLLNASLDPTQRLKALTDIGSLKSPSAGGALKDSAVVGGAITLANTAIDPAIRAQVWRAMRGSRNPALVDAVTSSLLQEIDGDVRLYAVILLQEDFSDDPRAREALEIVAQKESRPLVRALATRALAGETAWKDYVVASLKDSNRSTAARIEAFMHYVAKPGPTPGSRVFSSELSKSPELLDDEAIQALTQLLPEAAISPETRFAMPSVLSSLGSLKKPAITSLFLGLLEHATEPTFKYSVVGELGRRADDAAARAALDKISREDPDVRLRELAATALNGSLTSR